MDPLSGTSESESLEVISDHWVPVHVGKDIPVPPGVSSFKQWAATLVTMPIFRSQKWTFGEILDQGRSTKEIRNYLQWLHRTYASETNLQTEIVGGRLVFVHAITCQAVDLALFMEACDYEGELEAINAEKCGYSRQFKE